MQFSRAVPPHSSTAKRQHVPKPMAHPPDAIPPFSSHSEIRFLYHEKIPFLGGDSGVTLIQFGQLLIGF